MQLPIYAEGVCEIELYQHRILIINFFIWSVSFKPVNKVQRAIARFFRGLYIVVHLFELMADARFLKPFTVRIDILQSWQYHSASA